MGIHGLSNSFKRRNLYMSKSKVVRMKKKQKRNQRRSRLQPGVDPVDFRLMNEHQRSKLRKNPSAHITLSGKKRRKILQAIRIQQKERSEAVETTPSSSSSSSSKAARKRKGDVEMRDVSSTSDASHSKECTAMET